MNDFVEHLRGDLKELVAQAQVMIAKMMGKTPPGDVGSIVHTVPKTNYEINLVPEVKMQMIKAQKVRNLVLFICIVVSSMSVGIVLVLFGIKSGQDIAMSNQDNRLEQMSIKLNSYSGINELVTIQHQLEGIDEINSQKTVIGRIFGALGVMMPQGSDIVKLSQLIVNMDNNLIQMEGQADAQSEPLIDYRVLESFKKSASLAKYDYGRYVDVDGNEIPTHCIEEVDRDGNALRNNDNYYAWWNLQIPGCEASQRGGGPAMQMEGAKLHYSSVAEVEMGVPEPEEEIEIIEVCDENGRNCEWVEVDPNAPVEDPENPEAPVEAPPEEPVVCEEGDEECGEQIVPLKVKVWRTPQYSEWYGFGRMTLEGKITGIEHFESECITYRGTRSTENVHWTSTNDCNLVDESYEDGLQVLSSNNARNDSGNLVLKFEARTSFVTDFFAFSNKHMIAIGPLGQNVTDSYVQIGQMFTAEAKECDAEDTECLGNTRNSGGTL